MAEEPSGTPPRQDGLEGGDNPEFPGLRTLAGLVPFGSERALQRQAAAQRRQNAQRLAAAIQDGALSFSGNIQDDLAALASRVNSMSMTPSPNSTPGRGYNSLPRSRSGNLFAERTDLTPSRVSRTGSIPTWNMVSSWRNNGDDGNSQPTEAEQASINRDIADLARMGKPFPDPTWLSDWDNYGILPPIECVLGDLPICILSDITEAPVRGVIVIRNTPYYVHKSEVIQLISREAKITSQPNGTPYLAVYITMERESGKTGDIYIECQSHAEAVTTVRVFDRRQKSGRPLTLCRLPVKLEVSTQEEMMRAIFPNACRTAWNGQTPVVDLKAVQWQPGHLTRGFDGFLTEEEANLMLKFLGDPARSPFLGRGPHRLFDAVLTLLAKFPVWAPEYILLKDRKRLFDITLAAVKLLAAHIVDPERKINSPLTLSLMRELIVNALCFKIFTDAQKDAFIRELGHPMFKGITRQDGIQHRFGGTHELASRWPWLSITRELNVSDDFIRFYVKLISHHAQKTKDQLTNIECDMVFRSQVGTAAIEPFVAFRVDYGVFTDRLGELTLGECYEMEMVHLRRTILTALSDAVRCARSASV